MKLIVALCVSCVITYGNVESRLRSSIHHGKGLISLAADTDSALEGIIEETIGVLRENGEEAIASDLEHTFNSEFKGYLEREVSNRNIGDYLPLSNYLAIAYEVTSVALKCGIPGKYDICQATHISDLKTLNYTIPVVFQPCGHQWGKADYEEHFAGDANYYGLFPVTTFWGCLGGTFSSGWTLICQPAEWLSSVAIAPSLGGFVYDTMCP